MSLARCRVVLVRTHYPGNLGAAARVMRNFGLTALALAQAVAISLYELFRLSQKRAHPALTPPGTPPAPFAEQERMFAALRQALEEVHFLFGAKADALMHAVRHLIGRAQPTRQEVK